MDTPLITTEEEYRHVVAQMETSTQTIRAQAKEENWTFDRLGAKLVEELLPAYKAITDPASPVAPLIERTKWLENLDKQKPGIATVLQDSPWNEVVAKETAALNSLKNVNYSPPPIILIDGLVKLHFTDMEFQHDALLIDKQYFAAHKDDPLIAAGMAHELSHRYQRDDTTSRIKLMTDYFNERPTDSHDYEIVRAAEAEADFNGRRITPKGMMSAFLYDTFREYASGRGHYLGSHPGMTINDAALNFEELPARERKQWDDNAMALPAKAREAAFALGVKIIDSVPEPTHPPLQDRLSLQTALDKYDAVLSCKNVELDGNAHIVEATECGPQKVPLIVDGVPTGQKLTR